MTTNMLRGDPQYGGNDQVDYSENFEFDSSNGGGYDDKSYSAMDHVDFADADIKNQSFHASELIKEICPGAAEEDLRQQKNNFVVANQFGMIDKVIEPQVRQSMYNKNHK